MQERRFGSAHEMMAAALDAASASECALVLTPTSRLAKRYRHARRMTAVDAGRAEAWETPEILGFARWVRSQYDALWESRALLPRAGQLRFWADAFAAVPLPEEFEQGLSPTPALFSKLQQTYDLLCRKNSVRTGPEGESLSRWRGAVIRKYEALLSDNGYRAWDGALRAVARAMEDGRLPCPRSIVAIVREEPEALEREFLQSLERAGSQVFRWSLGRDGAPACCKVYATPEQECRAVCHEARLAWNASEGKSYLGIVAMDETYFPLLRRALEDLSGRVLPPEGQTRFNFAWGAPLTDHPLFQTAVLPLRLAAAEAPAALLSSLLCSPFTRLSRHEVPTEKLRETLWPEEESLAFEGALKRLAGMGSSARNLARKLRPFSTEGSRQLREWVADLREAWNALGFAFFGVGVSEPVRDAQVNAWEGLERAILDLERLAGDLSMESGDALDWLQAACEGRQVVIPGAESGGIQVLGLRESFGIPVDRLWLVGCHGGILPAPRPAEPLLAPEEKLRMGRKAHEEAWDMATRDLAILRALCSDPDGASFSRAFTGAGDTPFLSSPFFSDQMEERLVGEGDAAKVEKVPFLFDVWKEEKGTWLAARWLAATERGLHGEEHGAARESQTVQEAVPKELSVSGLKSFLGCPFFFFAEHALGLKPLPSPPDGLSPLDRGNLVHEILKEFVGSAPERVERWPIDGAGAWDYLQRLAQDKLGEKPRTAEWRAEGRWLLGEGGQAEGERPGVLQVWLEAELAHRRAGWKPVDGALEVSFRGLEIGAAPISLRGKIDRVDEHAELGRWVMDYKTGALPAKGGVYKKYLEPQLPAYCAAVIQGCMEGDARTPWEGPVTAGYIPLQKASEVEIVPFFCGGKKGAITREWVTEWTKEMEARLASLGAGRFPAEPHPLSGAATAAKEPCLYCAMKALCGFYDDAIAEIGDLEEEGQA